MRSSWPRQETAIKSMKPGRQIQGDPSPDGPGHRLRAERLGLMKGDVEEAVLQGAHALFFPHGLGHMLGLDVHDMENLGENTSATIETVQRSAQFGLAYLRMAKELEPGYVLTVEPGIYFIPALIDKWKKEKKFTDFIAYDKLEAVSEFRRDPDRGRRPRHQGRPQGPRPARFPKSPAKIEESREESKRPG